MQRNSFKDDLDIALRSIEHDLSSRYQTIIDDHKNYIECKEKENCEHTKMLNRLVDELKGELMDKERSIEILKSKIDEIKSSVCEDSSGDLVGHYKEVSFREQEVVDQQVIVTHITENKYEYKIEPDDSLNNNSADLNAFCMQEELYMLRKTLQERDELIDKYKIDLEKLLNQNSLSDNYNYKDMYLSLKEGILNGYFILKIACI